MFGVRLSELGENLDGRLGPKVREVGWGIGERLDRSLDG